MLVLVLEVDNVLVLVLVLMLVLVAVLKVVITDVSASNRVSDKGCDNVNGFVGGSVSVSC